MALITGALPGIDTARVGALADDGAGAATSYVASGDKAEAVVRELEPKGFVRSPSGQTDAVGPRSDDSATLACRGVVNLPPVVLQRSDDHADRRPAIL